MSCEWGFTVINALMKEINALHGIHKRNISSPCFNVNNKAQMLYNVPSECSKAYSAVVFNLRVVYSIYISKFLRHFLIALRSLLR